MSGYTVHTGSTEKFSEGWDRIFSNSPQDKTPPSKAAASKKAAGAKKNVRSAKGTKAKKST